MARQSFECGKCGGSLDSAPWWCPACGSFLSVGPRVTRPVEYAIRAAALRPSSELYHERGRWLSDLPEDLRQVVGRLPADLPYLAIVSGPAGAGKSCFCLRLADYFARGAPVAYYLVEEVAPAAVGEKLRLLEIANPSLLIGAVSDLGVLRDQVEASGAVAVFLDSISYLTLTGRDLAGLVLDLGVPLWGTQHVNKDLTPRGPADLAHVADVHIHLPERGRFEIRKSRFSPVAEGAMA